MSNREELDKLIEAAFSDKELTPKEMGILIQKAKELGINEDEFIIELDARMHKLKKKKERQPRSTSPNSLKRFFSKKVIILFIVCSVIVIGLLIVNEFKPTRYKSVKRVKGEFYNSIEKKDFVRAYEYLNELKVITSEFDHFDYHKELLNSRIPYLLGNNAWEVAFSEIKEVKNYKYDSYDAIQYTQEILFLIADHEIKNGNFNHASQVLDYLFIGIPSDDLNKEGFISFMKTCTNYLLSQSKYKEALSLINYYPIPNYEATVKYYEDSHDYYNKDALMELLHLSGQ